MFPAPASPSRVWHYPAITTCICETRRPNRDEIRVVAARIWREGLAIRFGERTRAASFGTRRLLVRAALVALNGTDR